MKDYLRTPKIQLSLSLALILLASLILNPNLELIIFSLITVGSAILFDMIFVKIRKVALFLPSAAVATGLIIALLLDPSSPIYIPIITSAIAMFSKNFIRPGRHIFNPASFGLIGTSLIFALPVAWWGPGSLYSTELSRLPFFLLLFTPGLVSIVRMKRHFVVLFFFLSYVSLTFVTLGRFTPDDAIRLLLDPVTIFFALVMAPEPMTTPSKRNNQILFGLFLGLVAVLLAKFLFQFPIVGNIDPLILSLLLGNLLFFKRR